MKKNKKIVITVVCLVLVCGLVAGLVAYIVKNNNQPVNVYNIEDCLLYATYLDDSNTSYGLVETDQIQTIYLSSTQEITGINVEQGQRVTEGQVLVTYDTTLSQLSLDRQKLEIEKQKMRLTDAKAQLAEIKKMKPITYVPGTKPTTAPTTEPTEEDTSDFGELEGEFKFIRGEGTLTAYKIIWVREDIVFDNDLIAEILDEARELDELYATLLMLKDDVNTGKITNRIDMKFMRAEVEDTNPADETEPSEPEPSDPDPTEPEPSEPEPSEPEPSDPEPTEPEPTEPLYHYSFAFLPGIDVNSGNSGNTGSGGTDASINYNSGYTSGEIAQMRADKEAEIKELEFTIKMAEAEYKIMQKEYASGGVTAEVDGYVLSVIPVEQALITGEPLIKVSAGGGFTIEGTISELKRDSLQIGDTVQLESMENGKLYSGTITGVGDYPVTESVYTDGNPAVSYYPFTVFVDETADLRADSYVEIVYAQNQPQQNLYLDAAFVRTENGKYYVYVQSVDGLLEKREIQTGGTIYDGSHVRVLSGLNMWDNIAFPYGRDIREGAETIISTMDDLYGSSDLVY